MSRAGEAHLPDVRYAARWLRDIAKDLRGSPAHLHQDHAATLDDVAKRALPSTATRGYDPDWDVLAVQVQDGGALHLNLYDVVLPQTTPQGTDNPSRVEWEEVTGYVQHVQIAAYRAHGVGCAEGVQLLVLRPGSAILESWSRTPDGWEKD